VQPVAPPQRSRAYTGPTTLERGGWGGGCALTRLRETRVLSQFLGNTGARRIKSAVRPICAEGANIERHAMAPNFGAATRAARKRHAPPPFILQSGSWGKEWWDVTPSSHQAAPPQLQPPPRPSAGRRPESQPARHHRRIAARVVHQKPSAPMCAPARPHPGSPPPGHSGAHASACGLPRLLLHHVERRRCASRGSSLPAPALLLLLMLLMLLRRLLRLRRRRRCCCCCCCCCC